MYRIALFVIAPMLACFALAVQVSQAQVVSFSFGELATDGGNLDASGVQVLGHNASEDTVSSNGINWLLNDGNFASTAGGGIGDRNNRVGGVPAPYDTTTVGGNGEIFINDSGFGLEIDAYHDPALTGVETDLHDAMESILFGGTFDITLSNLIAGHDYRVQIVSWDAAVEGEGDGDAVNTKEYRFSTIEATSAGASGSLAYNQFVTDGGPVHTTPDGLFGNSSDEITAALITAEFTATGTDVTFTMAVDQSVLNSTGGVSNDNAIYNALAVHDLTIPEPSTGLLALLGVAGAASLRRRS